MVLGSRNDLAMGQGVFADPNLDEKDPIWIISIVVNDQPHHVTHFEITWLHSIKLYVEVAVIQK